MRVPRRGARHNRARGVKRLWARGLPSIPAGYSAPSRPDRAHGFTRLNSRLTAIRDSAGRDWTLTYDASNRLPSIKNPA
ncbi:MAG TPA: RHS repeat domain-containing protein [Actinomycetota bacterium]|nr:RHS repeat domain-containing protein [Actinomycetota bacterium]